MGSPNRARTLALRVVAVSGAAVLLLVAGCSPAVRGLRLSGSPARGTRTAFSSQQTYDLMPSPRPKNPTDSKAATRRQSPDGKWVAYESDRDGVHGVWVERADGSAARRVSGAHLAVLPTWSPDGSRLLFLQREFTRPDMWSAWVVEVPAFRATRVASTASVRVPGASWFPDSRRLCYSKEDRLVVVDIVSGATATLLVPSGARPVVAPVAVSPDGSRILFAVVSAGVWIASFGDGRVERLIPEADVDAFAWAPGGRQIAFRTARDGQWKVHLLEP